MQENRIDTVKNEFLKHLSSLGLSTKSLKNYKSDLNHFLSWAILKVRSYGSFVEDLTDIVPFLSPSITQEYQGFMTQSKTSTKTANRRLSTLRHLAKFLIYSQITDINFMDNIENTSLIPSKKRGENPFLLQFKTHLEAEKVSPNTVKNYLNDIKQFLNWIEAKN
jgi:site-specific recombinase XerD